jgi:hypothetical protein
MKMIMFGFFTLSPLGFCGCIIGFCVLETVGVADAACACACVANSRTLNEAVGKSMLKGEQGS